MSKKLRVIVTMDPETEKYFKEIKAQLAAKDPHLLLFDGHIVLYMLSYCTLEAHPDYIADQLIYQARNSKK